MGCPSTPLSCLEPSNIFAGIYNPACGGFADPSNFQAERAVLKSNYEELINNYGVDINYYVNGFNLSACNPLYGEHTTQEYSQPISIRMYLELQESFSLSRFGINSEDEVTGFMSIKSFYNTANTLLSSFYSANGQRIEPKSDDLIEITSLGCDRPGDRGAKIFRITQVEDQNTNAGLNPLLGHYVWKIMAKRYETSHETNAPVESGNDQIYENLFSGKESSTLYPELTGQPKVYDQDINETSKNDVYDMSKNDTSLYGDYY
jgi:hypothetical protein